MYIQLLTFFLITLVVFPLSTFGGNQINLGPEIYRIKRMRAGGAAQLGRMDGARVELQRNSEHCFHLGAEALYATGTLVGQTGGGNPLRSELTDAIFEGRIGYIIKQCTPKFSSWTPFIGYGYFYQENDFRPPTAIPWTFTNTFQYFSFGFLSRSNISPLLSVNFNFKIKYMLNGRSKITDDPGMPDITLTMNNKTQYRVELPLAYNLSNCNGHFYTTVSPFYEYRHFGGRDGVPFNFTDTKFQLLGVFSSCSYRF